MYLIKMLDGTAGTLNETTGNKIIAGVKSGFFRTEEGLLVNSQYVTVIEKLKEDEAEELNKPRRGRPPKKEE